jgi:hypothetical protein
MDEVSRKMGGERVIRRTFPTAASPRRTSFTLLLGLTVASAIVAEEVEEE